MKQRIGTPFGKLAGITVMIISLSLFAAGLISPTVAKAADDKDAILIGYVSAFSGPLSQFTQAIKFVGEKALKAINQDGGIYIEEYGKKLPVKVIYADTESSPVKASEAANKLVLTDKVDLLVAAWTPDHINPVSAVAERHRIPALMQNGPIESWLTGGPYKWAYGNLFSLHKMVDAYIEAWDTVKTNKKVGFIFDSNVDGILLSKLTRQKAEAKGYTVVDPGRFPMGTKDYSTIISLFKSKGVDIIIANMITPDFGVCWNQFHQQGFIPKIFTIGKGMHFTTDIVALGGSLGNGLLSEDMWAPSFPFKSPLTGQTAAEFTQEFESSTGKHADCTLGYDLSTFEVIHDVFTRAKSVDRKKVRQALDQTNFDGIYGRIQYNDKNIAEVPVVVSQWRKTADGNWTKDIIANGTFDDIPLANKPLFFISDAK